MRLTKQLYSKYCTLNEKQRKYVTGSYLKLSYRKLSEKLLNNNAAIIRLMFV